ncbi:MAG: hypothetical protein HY822_07770 [Acidobacteria bacterium]|nr:hypothetical protein [Acidobacteriota bacterium]
MHTRAKHPEVLALAAIVLLSGAGARSVCAGFRWDDCDPAAFEVRLHEQVTEIGTRMAEHLEALAERMGSLAVLRFRVR